MLIKMTSEQQKEQLKFQRRNKKGSLTRALNILKAAVDEMGERKSLKILSERLMKFLEVTRKFTVSLLI